MSIAVRKLEAVKMTIEAGAVWKDSKANCS